MSQFLRFLVVSSRYAIVIQFNDTTSLSHVQYNFHFDIRELNQRAMAEQYTSDTRCNHSFYGVRQR